MRLLSELARVRAASRDCSRSGRARGDGTFSVTVRMDPTHLVHIARVSLVAAGDYATFTIACAGTTPVVA